ncbi:uracil DNA glycosylase superfamily protein [mine drainage metagenome]|uniref:Type-4 uracil-DNA glycosylase n=1 Tax=mine drainage metagenome TaxID=410659 RepID=A0A1J5RUR5_9ZZZZ
MNRRRDSLLREMGLAPLWKRRAPAPAALAAAGPDSPAAATVSAPAPVDRAAAIAAMSWDELRQSVAECRACELCRARRQAVLGVGDLHPDWLFVGEGPGAEEDAKGEPFVGQAGRLLDAMLAAIGLRRGEGVYIANAVKCRPPDNRTPTPDEIAACRPYLARQIELLVPRLIVALGRPAAQTLLDREVKIAALRGKLLDYRGTPLVVTYHPAYLLRNLNDKARAWEDLCFARATYRRGAQPQSQ